MTGPSHLASARRRTSVLLMCGRMFGLAAGVLLFCSLPVAAQEIVGGRDAAAPLNVSLSASDPSSERPFALKALYVSFAALEALDVHSTLRAVERGAHEMNPLVRALHSSPPALAAFKGASFASTVYLSERLRREHPKGALMTMIGLNAAYCLIVAHNYRTPSR